MEMNESTEPTVVLLASGEYNWDRLWDAKWTNYVYIAQGKHNYYHIYMIC